MSLKSDESLIQAALDGELDARAFARFEDRLRAEPGLRALYRSYSHLTGGLEDKFRQAESLPSRPRRSRRPLWIGLAAAAAAGLALPFLLSVPAVRPVVQFGPESHGRLIHGQPADGDSTLVPGSGVEIEHGSAAIRFSAGGQAYVEGPGRIDYRGDREFFLKEGRAWFESGGQPLVCRGLNLAVEAADGGFGLLVDGAGRQEVYARHGKVRLRTPGSREWTTLDVGESVRWIDGELQETQDEVAFSTRFPRLKTVFEEHFAEPDLTPLAGKMPVVGEGPWEVEIGGPLIEDGVLDTSGNLRHMAFAPLGELRLDERSHVLLVTLESEDPSTSRFHSEGWAGVSLFTGDQERIFVGDPNGPEEGWALHPAGYNARHACPLLEGRTTVTMRYDFRTGLAQLFEGTDTTGPALASEWVPPGLTFDRLRIANGSQADAAVDAGKPAEAAGSGPDVHIRGDIAIRRIRVAVLSSAEDEEAY